MLIFITGYMGSGKTTLAGELAGCLDYQFLDLDDLIENHTGKSIEKIFEDFGEEGFRKIEKKILQQHLGDKDTVIATGGGTPCHEDNMEMMIKAGLTVFLDAPVERIIERLKSEAHFRPLIRNIEPGKLPGFIREHLDSRRIYYAKAHLAIEEGGVDKILEVVRGCCAGDDAKSE